MKFLCVSLGVLLLSVLAIGQNSDPNDVAISHGSNPSPDDQNTTTTSTAAPKTDSDSTTAGPTTPSIVTGTPPVVDPDSEPKTGKYNYTNSGNVTCILFHGAIRFNFTYMKQADNASKHEEVSILHDIIPSETIVSKGQCNANKTEFIQLEFFDKWTLTITFSEDKDRYTISQLELQYMETNNYFPDTIDNGTYVKTSTIKDVSQFKVDNDKSMTCKSKVDVHGFDGSGTLHDMYTWHVQFEAFRKDKHSSKFSDTMYCDADTKVSNLVPIIVGAALAGLVLIVLVAYLIGRSRNKRGYESV